MKLLLISLILLSTSCGTTYKWKQCIKQSNGTDLECEQCDIKFNKL